MNPFRRLSVDTEEYLFESFTENSGDFFEEEQKSSIYIYTTSYNANRTEREAVLVRFYVMGHL
jgi:hypothetical protein